MTRSELINDIIRRHNYKSYLEIGVNTPAQPGYSHENIKVDLKHGVDPAVNTTFKMESDVFFSDHISQKYDLIFIDGLHIFEQAYRDIVNGLRNLSEGGTIVVHDCNPIEEITQMRERVSNSWHGDVWKAILKLRVENPNVEILTVDSDEGCSIIRRGHQVLLSFSEDDDIYSFNFFNKNRDTILNLISVEDYEKKFGQVEKILNLEKKTFSLLRPILFKYFAYIKKVAKKIFFK